MSKVFYHGGLKEDFNIEDIDIYHTASKQGSKYAGFYMFDEKLRDKAFHYAEQTNFKEKTTDRGVVRLELNDDLNIKTFERMFEIDRLTKEQLEQFKNEGYDLVSGRSFEGTQYVLLNPNKIENTSFLSMDKRYPDKEVEKEVNNIINAMAQGIDVFHESEIDNARVKGFIKLSILTILTTILCICFILIGVLL